MKVFLQGEIKFDEKELKTDLGKGNIIFVGSSCDMFADGIPDVWITTILMQCNRYPNNTYLFQTKNPKRFQSFQRIFPKSKIIGITLETNRENNLGKAPPRSARMDWFTIDYPLLKRKMVTIEPIMDFDVMHLGDWIKRINPEFVNIGADSKGHNLPEPSKEKIEALIKELKKFTKVNLKDNLKRLIDTKP